MKLNACLIAYFTFAIPWHYCREQWFFFGIAIVGMAFAICNVRAIRGSQP